MPERENPVVVALLGADFSGGSLVNLMLDSHPQAFGAGDVYKLFDEVKGAACSVCLRDCPIWNDEELLSALTPDSVYARVMDRTGADVLVDSSKTLRHFEEVFSRDKERIVPLVLTKHPARLMGSFLANKFIPAEIGVDDYEAGGLAAHPQDRVFEAIDGYFLRLTKQYRSIENFLSEQDVAPHRLKYEDVVTSPADALSGLLDRVGLPWTDRLLAFSDLEHHPIGGNAAAHTHLRRQRNPKLQQRRENRMIDEKRAFYADKDQALKLDNKYASIVPAPWRSELFGLDSYSGACAQLGYDAQEI